MKTWQLELAGFLDFQSQGFSQLCRVHEVHSTRECTIGGVALKFAAMFCVYLNLNVQCLRDCMIGKEPVIADPMFACYCQCGCGLVWGGASIRLTHSSTARNR